MKGSLGRIVSCSSVVVALLSLAASAEAQTEQPSTWSAAVGMNALSTSLGSGSGYQAEVRRNAFAINDTYAVDYALFGAFGSARHSPFECELARQRYCFGGTESIRTAGIGLTIGRTNATRIVGFDVSPRVLAGVAVTHVLNEEGEGPTGVCLSGSEFVSCPDDPPFQTISRSTTGMVPALGYGVSLAKSYGRLGIALDLTAYQTGWRMHDQLRVGAGVQFQFLR